MNYPPPRCKKCNYNLDGPKFDTGKCPACGYIDQEILDFFDEDAIRRYERLHPEDIRAARNAIRMAAALAKQKSPELN